jgi:hypothetical protein
MAIPRPVKAVLWALAIGFGAIFGMIILMVLVTLPTTVRRDTTRPTASTTPARPTPSTPVSKVETPRTVADDPERVKAAEARRLAAKWSYAFDTDAMTSRKSTFATIKSENTVTFDFPYRGAQHGTLMLRDHPSYGRDVIFSIERGQILCHSYEDCSIRVRFDEGNPQHWNAIGPKDNSSTDIFLRNEASFVQKLRTAKVVRIQVPVYHEGEPIFEFRVGGFDNAAFKGNFVKIE